MKTKTLLPLTLLLLAPLVVADSYSHAVNASYLTLKSSDNIDTTYKTVGAAHYFSPVQYTNQTPYAMESFVQESGHIGLIYTRGDIKDHINNATKQESFHGLGKFYIPQTQFNLELALTKVNASNGQFAASESDWGLTAGWKPNKHTEVTSSYWHDFDYELNLEVSHLMALQNRKHLALQANYEKAKNDNDKNYYSLSADYYPALSTSFGLSVSKYFETAYGATFHHFFTKSIHGLISYNKEKDEKAYQLMLGYRF